MSIVRVNKDTRYFTASNEPFNDKRLRWETRGLLAYLLSKPDNWTVRLADLSAQGPAGDHKIKMMLKDAQKYGYMNRIRIAKEDGTFYWITEVYESPSLNPNPQSSMRFSTSGLSTSGKLPDIVITELTNTELTTTTTTAAEQGKNIFQLYEENIGALTPMIADTLKEAEDTYAEAWIREAIQLSVEQNKRNWSYCLAILKRWDTEGKDEGRKRQERTEKKERKPKVEVKSNEIARKVARNVFGTR